MGYEFINFKLFSRCWTRIKYGAVFQEGLNISLKREFASLSISLFPRRYSKCGEFQLAEFISYVQIILITGGRKETVNSAELMIPLIFIPVLTYEVTNQHNNCRYRPLVINILISRYKFNFTKFTLSVINHDFVW